MYQSMPYKAFKTIDTLVAARREANFCESQSQEGYFAIGKAIHTCLLPYFPLPIAESFTTHIASTGELPEWYETLRNDAYNDTNI